MQDPVFESAHRSESPQTTFSVSEGEADLVTPYEVSLQLDGSTMGFG